MSIEDFKEQARSMGSLSEQDREVCARKLAEDIFATDHDVDVFMNLSPEGRLIALCIKMDLMDAEKVSP